MKQYDNKKIVNIDKSYLIGMVKRNNGLSNESVNNNKELIKIQKTNFYTQKKNDLNFNNQLYSTIIISTDPEYISWLRLRIGYFENIDETSESNGNRTFKSDGIYGEFNKNECEITSPFTTLKYNIHPLLLIDKCKSSLVEFLTLYEKNVNS